MSGIKNKIKDMLSLGGVFYFIIAVAVFLLAFWHIGNAFNYKPQIPVGEGYSYLEENVIYSQDIEYVPGYISDFYISVGSTSEERNGSVVVKLLENGNVFESFETPVSELRESEFVKYKLSKNFEMNPNSNYSVELVANNLGDTIVSYLLYSSDSDIRIGTDDSFENYSMCYYFDRVNLSEKNTYMPIYMAIVVLLIIFSAFFIDFKKFTVLKAFVYLLLITIATGVFDYSVLQNIETNPSIYLEARMNPAVIEAGETKEFNMFASSSSFDECSLYVGSEELESSDFEDITFELTNRKETYTTSKFSFDPSRDNGYIVKFSNPNGFEKGNYSVSIKSGLDHNFMTYVKNNGDLNTTIKMTTFVGHKIAMIVAFIVAAYLIVLFGFVLKDFSISKFYIATVIPLALIYLVIFAVWNHPDTEAHYLASYRFSNSIVLHDENRQWFAREDDADLFLNKIEMFTSPTVAGYDIAYDDFSLTCDSNQIVDTTENQDKMTRYSAVGYLPQVVGLIIGRLFNLSSFWTVMCSRILILALYIFATYRAVKKMPVGKGMLAFLALMPSALMFASSFSYDAMVIITTLSFVASIFDLYKNRNSKAALAETCLWIFAICAVKGGGYILLIPLAFMLYEKPLSKERKEQMLLVMVSGLFSILIFNVLLTMGKDNLYQLGAPGSDKLMASYSITHPVSYFGMLFEAFIKYFDQIFTGSAGAILGWNDTAMPVGIASILIVLTLFYGLIETNSMNLKKKDIFILLSVVLLGVLMIPAMLLSYTSASSRSIDGIQGRYFYPLILPLFLSIVGLVPKIKIEDSNKQTKVVSGIAVTFVMFSLVGLIAVLKLYLGK